MFKRVRLKWAYKFGRIEHRFGRYIGLFSIIAILLNLSQKNYIIDRIMLIIIFCVWAIYLMSHTLEKKFFGHMGPRG